MERSHLTQLSKELPMAAKGSEYVSWYDYSLWRDDISRHWGKSVVVHIRATAAPRGQPYADLYTVYATPLCGRIPDVGDPHVSAVWPNERWHSVPAMLVHLVVELDRLLAEREAERRSRQAF